MKRYFAGMAAALLAVILAFSLSVDALSADSAVVLDATSNRFIFEKNPDKKSLIASTTKIMTALVVCEQSNVLDRVRIPKEAVGIEGSSIYLKDGEILTVQELLYGLMMHSGNDAAVALAIYCGGTVEGFAELMNDKARQLGMKDSHFENPNGLDAPEHYSTARDLAILASYAMENPVFYKTVSARNVTVGERHLRNHNKLLWLYEGADGVKTGYTRAAGRILVSSATRDGRRLIAVTINAPDDWNDHMAMLNQGFSGFEQKRIVSTGEIIGFAEIAGGFSGSVQLLAADNFDYALAPDEKVSFVMPGTGFVYAPVACGADAGFVHVCVDGKSVGKVPVQYGETIEQIPQKELNFWQRLVGGD